MQEYEVGAWPVEVTSPEERTTGGGPSRLVLYTPAPPAPPASIPRQWRRARGPRPVRPGVVPVGVRPAEPERPQLAQRVRRAEPMRGMPRVLVRSRVVGPFAGRARRMLAGLAVAAAAAAVVVALGLLAGVATQARGTAEPAGPARGVATVTVEAAEDTVWDVARRVAPAASGPELAAVAERIVTDNSLGSVELRPGQVLRVTTG